MRERERGEKKPRAKALDVSCAVLFYLLSSRASYLTSLERSKTRRRGYAFGTHEHLRAAASGVSKTAREKKIEKGREGEEEKTAERSSSARDDKVRIEGSTYKM